MDRLHFLIVRPAGYLHIGAYEDASAYLGAAAAALGVEVTASALDVEGQGAPAPARGRCVVVGAHLLTPAGAARLPPDAIVLNTERLAPAAAWARLPPAYRGLLAAHRVWDYAAPNLVRLPPGAAVIPFGHAPALVREDVPRTDGGRVLFLGVITPRRSRLLRRLRAHGVDVDVRFGCFGEARAALLRGARAVLNLHQDDDTTLFQPLRCIHALIQGAPVISEATSDPGGAALAEAVRFVPGPDPVPAIVAALADVAGFAAAAARADAAWRARDVSGAMRALLSEG